jgi:hypothetical protein
MSVIARQPRAASRHSLQLCFDQTLSSALTAKVFLAECAILFLDLEVLMKFSKSSNKPRKWQEEER